MRKHLFAVLLCCLIPATAVVAQAKSGSAGINQGDWAVAVVRSLNLDSGRELVKIEDFTALLQQAGIAPAGGWKVNEQLTNQDLINTVSQSLLYINSRNRSDGKVSAGGFLSFLETKIGISMAQLLANLPETGNLQNLKEGISEYLAQKQVESGPGNSTPAGAGNASSPAAKLKVGVNNTASLASPPPVVVTYINAIISDYLDALIVQNGGYGEPGTDYWNVFSAPASPILPYVAP